MREHSDRWHGQLKEAQSRMDSAIGDSIIAAACVSYFGEFVVDQKEQALKHWIEAAKHVR